MAVNIDREIDNLKRIPGFGRYLAQALTRLATGITNLGNNIGADPTKTLPAPTTPNSLEVKANGGLVHAVIGDQNEVRRGIHYFVEIANEKSFSKPHVVHLGASRTMLPISLPAMDDDGNPQSYFFRAYSQYPGSKPSKPIHFGGESPTPVNPGGANQMTLLPSTGSGSSPANGQSAGQGYGKVLHRPATVTIKPNAL